MAVQLPLDYLVILDLEATSDDPTDPHRAEIVEFPWLVYDLASCSVLDHKQVFITPRWNSNPNPPPDAVRGLGADVAFAHTLADAVLQFDSYVYQSFVVTGKSFYLVFDGHWDLTCLLFVEAARKAVVLAPHFRTYINLRTEFSRCYPTAPVPTDRKTMFAYLDIPTEQRASGLDECVALANLVSRLLRDGHRFTQPEVISDYDWATMPARIPAVATPLAAAVPVGGIVRLRGLPWTCTEADVENFLAGIPIVPSGVHFVRNSQGKATGEAFVQLETVEGVSMALARDKQSVGRRYIEVFKSSPVDMANHLGRADARRHMHASPHSGKGKTQSQSLGAAKGRQSQGKAKDSGMQQTQSPQSTMSAPGVSYVVKISGLPRTATANDVLSLFNGLEMVGEGIHMVTVDGETTGEAYVEFVSETWAKKALARSGTTITCSGVLPAPVEIRKSSVTQLHAAFAGPSDMRYGTSDGRERGKRNGSAGKASTSPELRFFLRVRNVDESVSTDQIRGLFERFQIRDDDVKFMKYTPGNGASSGEKRGQGERVARVTFRTREERDAALLSKDTLAFGSGSSVVHLEDAGSDGRGTRSGPGKVGSSAETVGNTSPRVVRMRGLPYTSNEDDIVQFFEGYAIAPGGITRGKDRHGRASGEAWVTFVSAEDAREVVNKLDKAHMGNRYIELKF